MSIKKNTEIFFPPMDHDLQILQAPVVAVTLLEDRAHVYRQGAMNLQPGRNRLVVKAIAPVVHSLSLQAHITEGEATVADVRLGRAYRVRSEHKPDAAKHLEQQLEELQQQFVEVTEKRERTEQRGQVIFDMIRKGAKEVPDDAAWGLVSEQNWMDTFERLFKKSRDLQLAGLEHYFEQQDIAEQAHTLIAQRCAIDTPDTRFCAWIEADVDVTASSKVSIKFEYVVPNAMWRPLHRASLCGDKVNFSSSAVVWQNTGEDWRDVALIFSTARSSLGTEAPLLSDDLLNAQAKSNEVVVTQREVAIQSATVESADTSLAANGVDLPGVDDGGDIQNLQGLANSTVLSDGGANIVPIYDFTSNAEQQLLCMPELNTCVFLKTVLVNTAHYPILAGPVELIRDNGFVGWSQVLFVAQGETFEMSFGPDDSLRVIRNTSASTEQQQLDNWNITTTKVDLYLSNLAGVDKTLQIIERVPVAEIEHIKIKLLKTKSKPCPQMDKNGFCSWTVDLQAHGQEYLHLRWQLQVAPEVQLA